MITVTGYLPRDAERRITADGKHVVILLIMPERGGLPFVASRQCPSLEAAELIAGVHRRGDKLAVEADGISRLRIDHDVPALVLLNASF